MVREIKEIFNIASKQEYDSPFISDGETVEIYACRQGTCNGRSHAATLELEDQELVA